MLMLSSSCLSVMLLIPNVFQEQQKSIGQITNLFAYKLSNHVTQFHFILANKTFLEIN
jgi:hypothetical protein